ncbi:MAG: SPOR domain-containing protein [Betaproteobacteria bacterium]|nr:SPOR domain-containing protein [Betaproteobacteria bacterium]
MAESQDVNTLKRRGRRRLVGSIALVLVAVIVLPWIFDPQPRQTAPVSVRIPNEDESAFKPKAVPKPAPPRPEAPATESKPASKPEAPAPQTDAKPVAAPPAKPAPDAAERARAEAALANAQFVVPVGAYAEPEGVLVKLKAAKIPYYTEPVATAQGKVTRVRAGPFATRDAAERALKQIKALGFKPGGVTTRS